MLTQQNKVDSLLCKIMFSLAAGIVVTQTLGLEQFTSWLFLLTFPLTVFLWLRTIRKTVIVTDVLLLATIALAVVNVLINASITGVFPGFSYLKKVIMFATTLLFFQAASRSGIRGELVRFINTLVDGLVIYFIIIYFVLNIHTYEIDGRISTYLTFRFSNPNLTAMFLICLYMLEVYRLFTREKWYLKALHIIMAVFLTWFIFQTRSRNAMIVFALFTAACAWLIFRGKSNLKVGKFWAAVVATLPATFVGFYYLMIYTPGIRKAFDFLVSEGKGLDSRIGIWNMGLREWMQSPILGAYSQLSKGSGTFQMHNSHVDIICSYGPVVLVLVCILLWRYLNQKDRLYTDKSSYIYILGFAGAIILGMGEAALFSGGIGVYIFAGSFLMLANYRGEEEQPE